MILKSLPVRLSDKIFFVIQSLLKYNSFNFAIYLRSLLYKPFFKSFGSGVKIKDGVTFKFPSEIELGCNCSIGEFSYFVGKKGLKIGNNALVAAGTKVITSTHNIENIDIPVAFQGLSFASIEIGNDVWIGFDVKIFGNTIIGNSVIIGAGSLVKNTRIEQYSVIAGVPAKLIKMRNKAQISN